jgi:hypothetical protein
MLTNEMLTPVTTPFSEFGSVRAEGDRAVFPAGAPDHPASIVTPDLASGRHSVLKKATDIFDRTDLHLGDYLTRVDHGRGNGLWPFYPPGNPDYAPSAEERPPLPGHDQRRPGHHVEAGGLEGKPVLWPEPLAKAK